MAVRLNVGNYGLRYLRDESLEGDYGWLIMNNQDKYDAEYQPTIKIAQVSGDLGRLLASAEAAVAALAPFAKAADAVHPTGLSPEDMFLWSREFGNGVSVRISHADCVAAKVALAATSDPEGA